MPWFRFRRQHDDDAAADAAAAPRPDPSQPHVAETTAAEAAVATHPTRPRRPRGSPRTRGPPNRDHRASYQHPTASHPPPDDYVLYLAGAGCF